MDNKRVEQYIDDVLDRNTPAQNREVARRLIKEEKRLSSLAKRKVGTNQYAKPVVKKKAVAPKKGASLNRGTRVHDEVTGEMVSIAKISPKDAYYSNPYSGKTENRYKVGGGSGKQLGFVEIQAAKTKPAPSFVTPKDKDKRLMPVNSGKQRTNSRSKRFDYSCAKGENVTVRIG